MVLMEARINIGEGSFIWTVKVLVKVSESKEIRGQLAPPPSTPFSPKYIWGKFGDSHFVKNI